MKLLNSYEVFDYTPEMIKESREANGGKIMMKGILQKADTLNQNGRIYPRVILEREVRNYQKFIIENRALGECVPPGTQIYTTSGWKNIEDISENEEIFTLDVDNNIIEKQHIVNKVVLPFNGNLLRFKDELTYDMCLTPSHKMLIWDKLNTKPTTVTASEFFVNYVNKNSFYDGSYLKSNLDVSSEACNAFIDFSTMNVEEIPYEGNVYCVTVPNGTWLMKYNGKVCWTHNCDHPDSSVVNLKNVSHIVREAKMQDNVVYGTIELLDTPSGKILQSLVESGVKLGISSRGVGSTRKEGDYQVVQEDFQLICWDMVSEPSTPGAFMMSEGKTVTRDELKRVFTKQDRIDRAINDILYYKK